MKRGRTNIAEGYRKRRYPRHFTSRITDADGEASETMVWLDFAKDCGYITRVLNSATATATAALAGQPEHEPHSVAVIMRLMMDIDTTYG